MTTNTMTTTAPADASHAVRSPVTLYEIVDEWVTLDAMLRESEGEVTPEVQAWMDRHAEALASKVDAIVEFAREVEAQALHLEAHAAIHAREGQHLTERALTRRRGVEALKRYVSDQMARAGTRKWEGPRRSITRVQNSAAPAPQPLVPLEQLPREWLRTTTVVSLDKDAVLAAHTAHPEQVAPLVSIKEAGHHVRFR